MFGAHHCSTPATHIGEHTVASQLQHTSGSTPLQNTLSSILHVKQWGRRAYVKRQSRAEKEREREREFSIECVYYLRRSQTHFLSLWIACPSLELLRPHL